ncbi:hypothetical protein PCANC_21817 [Puccinia coronata f. sp. avenae]|uniref:Uncharacterized protein n=1 Tax=Puccinia coronata f. sp. avenae TaxID=200324 RepID=A0A2N5SGA9_9BASI|nr:hypothetical protein PCANC_21817 [Puccinia coronata f. sp. avenae]
MFPTPTPPESSVLRTSPLPHACSPTTTNIITTQGKHNRANSTQNSSISYSKSYFAAIEFKKTNEMTDEEVMKIQTGKIGGSSPLTSTTALKPTAKKQVKKIKTSNPVELLAKKHKTYQPSEHSQPPHNPDEAYPAPAPNLQDSLNQNPPVGSAVPAFPAGAQDVITQTSVPPANPEPVPTPSNSSADQHP